MPRRVPDYPDAFAFWNSVASYGSLVSALSLVVFFAMIDNMLGESSFDPHVKRRAIVRKSVGCTPRTPRALIQLEKSYPRHYWLLGQSFSPLFALFRQPTCVKFSAPVTAGRNSCRCKVVASQHPRELCVKSGAKMLQEFQSECGLAFICEESVC
jgi:hypothetical protein